jgi:hypothetical protein
MGELLANAVMQFAGKGLGCDSVSTAWRPSAASPQTSQSGFLSTVSRTPCLNSIDNENSNGHCHMLRDD